MLKKLAGYAGKYKKASILAVVLIAAEVVMDILLPIWMAKIIDEGISKGNLGNVFLYGALMLVCAAVAFYLGMTAGRTAAYASTGYASNLRKGIFEKIQTFSFANIDRFSTAGLVTRLTTDVTNLQNAYQMIIRMCIRSPLMLIFAFIMTVIISPRISLVFLAAIVFLGICLFIIIKIAMKTFSQVFKKYDELNESVQENVKGIRVVKSFVREDHEISKFEKAINNLYKLFVKAEKIVCYNAPIMMLVVYATVLSVSWFSAKMIVAGTLTTGQLTSLLAYVINIFMNLMMLSMVFVMLSLSGASAERICEVLDEVPDIQNPEDPVMSVSDGSIQFKDVYFTYTPGTDKYVLRDVDLSIQSGETIGIIGGTGSSKSTLVNLISRLYDTSKGEVLVGGRNVREYDLDVLRDNVSVVLQTNVLFSGTILDNLRWGDENATEEECIHACRLACADEFIEQFPDGYNTWIEQGGTNVSGGQKQRLCIARALLKHPKILILDDSTSAVDTATDAVIRKSFREEIPDTTKIIISQRISSVKDADKIIVLENGVVDGFDTHEKLLESNAIYQSIYKVQTEGGGDFDRKEG